MCSEISVLFKGRDQSCFSFGLPKFCWLASWVNLTPKSHQKHAGKSGLMKGGLMVLQGCALVQSQVHCLFACSSIGSCISTDTWQLRRKASTYLKGQHLGPFYTAYLIFSLVKGSGKIGAGDYRTEHYGIADILRLGLSGLSPAAAAFIPFVPGLAHHWPLPSHSVDGPQVGGETCVPQPHGRLTLGCNHKLYTFFPAWTTCSIRLPCLLNVKPSVSRWSQPHQSRRGRCVRTRGRLARAHNWCFQLQLMGK